MKTIINVIRSVITFVLIVVLIGVVIQRVTNYRLAIGDMYIFQVATGSMEPEYPVGDVIVVKKADPSTINVGDDVTYKTGKTSKGDVFITHRVVEKREENGKYYFTTQGLVNLVADPEFSEDALVGKVTYHTVVLSFIGRLMNNMIFYYCAFVFIALSFSYDIITNYLIKRDDKDEEEQEEE
jgi:signal peptidase